MQRSKVLVSQALSTLKSNLDRSGDPLGLTSAYWTDWLEDNRMPSRGKCILLTARMYQMLPYVVQATAMVEKLKPILPILSVKAFRRMAEVGNRVVGETLLRLTARRAKNLKAKGTNALRGILEALRKTGLDPAYFYDSEPYSGVLLYDLGLEREVVPHIQKVYRQLKDQGVEKVITVDPHTTFMMKEVFPRHVLSYDIEVKHYLEVLADTLETVPAPHADHLPQAFVIHDSCVMTRDLGIIDAARRVAEKLGITLLEPENTRENTACCGGPVEYAYARLSGKISSIRARELTNVCEHILVMCPICMINLMKHEQTFGGKVWDMGEVLSACRTGVNSR